MQRTVNTLLLNASMACITIGMASADTTAHPFPVKPFIISAASLISTTSMTPPRIEPVDDKTISGIISKMDKHQETFYSKIENSYTLRMAGILTAEYKPSFGLTLTTDGKDNAVECRFDDEGDLSLNGMSSRQVMTFQVQCTELVAIFNQQIPDPITQRKPVPRKQIRSLPKQQKPKQQEPKTVIDKMAASDFTLYWRERGLYTFYMGGVLQAEYTPGTGLILREDKDENALECRYNEQLGLQIKKKETPHFRKLCSQLMLSFDEQISE